MTDPIDQLGPVDYLVVEFPGSKFTGEILPELATLVQNGTVRVLDLVLIIKDEAGGYEAFEMTEIDTSMLGELRELERELADLLSEEDVVATAEVMEPGSTAALLVYENLWAAPFASAVRHAGGQLVANGRIPVQALIAALDVESEAAVSEGQEQEV